MKYIIKLFSWVVFFGCLLSVNLTNAQVQPYINEELTAQIAENYLERTIHEGLYKSRIRRIKESTENVQTQYAKYLVAKEHVFNSIRNVNSALIQSKQIIMLGQDFEQIYSNIGNIVSLASQNPLVAPFAIGAVEDMTERALRLTTQLYDLALKADDSILMDYEERQRIVNEIRWDVRFLKESSGRVIWVLRYRSKMSLLENVTHEFFFNESIIINSVMNRYHRMVI